MTRSRAAAVATTLAASLVAPLLGVATPALDTAAARTPGSHPGVTGRDHRGPSDRSHTADEVQQALDRLVSEDGFPGAAAAVRDADGKVRTYTAGVSDLETRAPMTADGRVRIASNTKMFTATVVLQLVGEGKVDLDEPVETYLPGIVRGNGNDGREITVRNLLRQTSGLPDYDTIVSDNGGSLADIAHTYFEPRELVDAALAEDSHFAPGSQWEYSNTNYILLGLLAQRVTGRPIGEQVTQRIIEPLGMEDTYWPEVGEQDIRGAHPHGYYADGPGEPWQDLTRMDPSLGWAAGQLVATQQDLGRFMEALLGGELLEPAQLEEMRDTVPAPEFDPGDDAWEYGLGLARTRLECGVDAWGHGGDIQGFETRNLVTEDGRWAVVVVNALPTSLEMVEHVSESVETAICSS
ncbi:beta-lactamase family protein [Phycicoccus sp. CSK15P-2]|uniref:serine hydrolase domain-containing protein n=1 Tax=Phycicoccus sp. CSK15P-2 TaxID=2807627 RepID=UPI001950BE41|nr:serine hydrolase domain-containing protein [Phycicoccus sp. CSK15P-2]MBM6404532.1 beta-lactamase family protein [Phycicoccus sp. CSK15P-2]